MKDSATLPVTTTTSCRLLSQPAAPTKPNENIHNSEFRMSESGISDSRSTSPKPSFGSFLQHNRPSSMFSILRNKSKPNSTLTTAATPKKGKDVIDPMDGKTKACDRAKTFETFVDGEQLRADPGVAEQVGTTSDVKRGLRKVRGWFGKKKGDEER
ncbi:uncharacterized protein N0V89_003942 [Didymosphaeria variabile]|uniref:Uncharacterized protein n=1 Tax=Didymosphaeria variabile TaxID=1932322 RepID=A0A9W9CCZ7_9PLEO|nr:uncharacterized protein N0V89_003942 [Didymosphaeria variabile]KAJ4355917.1 hypothetical protein N0V89_003942 [Didymosphaeria variabile]